MRNSLKKIAMMPFDISYAIEFEHSYLLLAEDYIERGNFDLANDLAKRCLYYNRSSIKAWEIFGKTTELQNGSCNDVVQSYEKCWSLGNKSSHLSGYRLTALYIKMNKLTEALNTLPRVYSLSPENVSFKSLVSTLALSLRP
jgi:tetratricopeptide (TPR) repeat protein